MKQHKKYKKIVFLIFSDVRKECVYIMELDKEYVKNSKEDRQNSMPEVLTNNIYTPAFLREQIGKLVRIQFLIGTNSMEDRTGILEDVGASYVLLRSIESGNLLYGDIYSIKFVVIAERPYRPDHDFQV